MRRIFKCLKHFTILAIIIFLWTFYKKNDRFLDKREIEHDITANFRHKNAKSGSNHGKTDEKNSTGLLLRTTNNKSKQKTIVLFTYYRSGSTFTGQLLNQHPGIA